MEVGRSSPPGKLTGRSSAAIALLFCLALLSVPPSQAQSLVPNGDFEEHTGCPDLHNELFLAVDWSDPSYWSPDYYHMCGSNGFSVPENAGGYQMPLSGSAYAGIFLYTPGILVREYIETPLTAPLVAGSTYQFQMFINLADSSLYSVRNIGVYFSDTLISMPTVELLPFTPQIVNLDPSYPDTADWYSVSGTYTAEGGEGYLIIGNFNDDAGTPLTISNPTGFNYAYVYVDNVSLALATGIDDPEQSRVLVGPVPFREALDFILPVAGQAELRIFDLSSRLLFEGSFSGTAHLATSTWPSGSFIYTVRFRDGRLERGLVVKE